MNTTLSDRQQQIIEQSLSLIAEGGIQGLTIKNLARRIGFSESAIYRHFENKTEILVAILDHFRVNTRQLFLMATSGGRTTAERLSLWISRLFALFSQSPSLVAVIFSEELFLNEPELLARVTQIMNDNIETMAGILQNGQQSGEVRNDIPAGHLALVLLGTLRLYVKQWALGGYQHDLISKGDELMNDALKLLTTSSS